MTTENKEINKDNTEKNKKKPKLLNKFIFLFVLSFILFIFFEIYVKKIDFINNKKDNYTEILNTENSLKNKEIEDNFNSLKEKITLLQEKLNQTEEEISVLKIKIDDLNSQNQKNQIVPQSIALIKLALKIQDCIDNNKNYKNNLILFKKLLSNSEILSKELEILTKYENFSLNNKNLLNLFNEEMSIFLKDHNVLKKKENNLTKFVSKFIIIRKIEKDENSSSDKFLNNLELNILEKNYLEAFKIINESEYNNYFIKTKNELNIYVELEQNIQNIIDYLINN